MTKRNSKAVSSWRVIEQEDGEIIVYNDSKFCIYSLKFKEIENYLVKWVNPNDIITFVGFREDDIQVKGMKFLKEYYVNNS